MAKSSTIKLITPSEKRVLEAYADKKFWLPPGERQIAKMVGCHFSYIGKVRKNLFLKGYLDEFGRPIK